MNKYWLMLIVAGLSEVGWVSGLKHANSWWTWLLTIAAILFSFYVMIAVSNVLPVGTTYAVFTGIGAAGTVLGESAFFGVPLNIAKLALIAVLIVGIVGLKLTAGHGPEHGKEEGR